MGQLRGRQETGLGLEPDRVTVKSKLGPYFDLTGRIGVMSLRAGTGDGISLARKVQAFEIRVVKKT